MVKCTVGDCGRYNHKSVGYRTLCLTGRCVYCFKLVGTFTDCAECCGVTAVKVERFNASECKHNFCLLLNGETDCLRSLATVSGHCDNSTVCGDTDCLTGILCCLVKTCSNCTVFYNVNVSADGLFNLAFI